MTPTRYPQSGLRMSYCVVALLSIIGLGLTACKGDPDILAQVASGELETRERGLEGLRFNIDVPVSFETRMTKVQGIPQTRFVHPKGDARSVPRFAITTRSKSGVRFPENMTTAKAYYQPEDDAHVLDSVESLHGGWLVITRVPDENRLQVRFSTNLPTRFTLECVAHYEGKREDEALALMKKVCGSLMVPGGTQDKEE